MRSRYIDSLYKVNNVKYQLFKYSSLILIALFCMSLSGPLYGAQFGNTIIAIYKSSDGFSEKKNPIQLYFEPEIKKMGLQLKYHDFDKGLPDIDSFDNVRAILTWYNGAVIENKEIGVNYINFLNKAVDSNVKLIIVNSFGVYGYKDSGKVKWDLINKIKPLYMKLGFDFKGFWTNDYKKLRIVSKDSSMVEKEAKQDVKKSIHYQQLLPTRGDVTTYLKIKRTDKVERLGSGISSVIMTSKNGGFALEQYVIQGSKMLLNPALFLRRSLFYDDDYQNVGIVIGDVKNKQFVIKNLNYTFKYSKILSSIIPKKYLTSMIPEDLYPYEVIIMITDTVNQIPAKIFKQYVKNGGRLIFGKYASLDKEFNDLCGIKKYSSDIKEFDDGYSIKSTFYLNHLPVTGEKIDLKVRKATLKKVKLIGTLLNKTNKKSYPVLWEKSFGKGKVLYWNTNHLFDNYKGFRGLIVQSIHYIYEGYVSALANIGLMEIDDYPAPRWNLNYKNTKTEYYNNRLLEETDPWQKEKYKIIINNLNKNYSSITDTDFISNFWLKYLKIFQKKFGFKYTTFLIFNYNMKANTKEYPVTQYYISDDQLSVKMGNLIINNGWELGFHGYNHMSLTKTKPEHYESLPWSCREEMLKALTSARNEWIKLYSATTLPFAYVAPHNIIDECGKSALAEAFPSIRVISTLYTSSQGEAVQEFEWTPNNRFYQIPRMSSGFHMNPSDENLMYDVIHLFGVVSHFVHPDDVFDEHRSAGYAGWDWLSKNFIKIFTKVKKSFPTVRWMTVKDAFSEFQFYDNTNIRVKQNKKIIQVESSDGSDKYLYFRMRLKKGRKIKKSYNCKLVHSNKKSGDMVFKTNNSKAKIVLR